jgi:CRISPR-associated endonuclease/helicase Cas3
MRNYKEKSARPKQPLEDHLKEVEKELKNEESKYLGLLHDIAKVSEKFQKKLKGEKNSFRHPVAALPIADYALRDDSNKLIKLLVIYYHHTPISFDMLQNDIIRTEDINVKSDYILTKEEIEDAFNCLKSLQKDFEFKLSYFDFLKHINCKDERKLEECYLKHINKILRDFYDKLEEIDSEFKFKFATAYNDLVSADWKNSGEIQNLANWEIIINNFNNNFKYQPNQVQSTVWKEAESDNNKIFLIAPTGSGKSEASLKWALIKAQKTGKKRIIYVLPFNNLIKDLYERFKEYIGEKNVDVWNSDYLYFGLNELNFSSFEEFNFNVIMRKYFMDKPLIITTADQILMSYLNIERYPIRLGLFKESVLVFDEIQGYGTFMRALLYEFINDVCKEKEQPVMVMTATPPVEIKSSLNPLNEFKEIKDEKWLKDFHGKFGVEVTYYKGEEIAKEQNKNKIKERMFKKIIEKVKELLEDEKINRIAIVVNTIKDSIKLYEEIKKDDKIKNEFKEDIVLLHASMIKEDRDERLNKILAKNNEKKKVLAVTTQVIEAGVDVNFDACIRMIAPFESLVQTLGRVNRCGKDRDGESIKNAKFIIFGLNENDKFLPYEKEEVLMVQKYLEQRIKDKIDRLTFENLGNEIQTDSEKFDNDYEYVKYICSNLSKNIWSTGQIEEVLGASLRENIKKTVFVKPDEKTGLESFEEKKKKLIEELKNNFDKEKLKEYISLLKEYNGNFINAWEKEDEISLKDYKKKYLGEDSA